MGKGKGAVSHWGARVRGGTVLFEICGVSFSTVLLALRTGGAKLPIKTKIFT
jgi:large subunit ribosomal protein L16